MANNYQQWSEEFLWPKNEKKKAEAQAWLEVAMAEPPEHADSPQDPWRDYDNRDGAPDFNYEVDPVGFVLYAEESGDIDGAVALVQEYFRRFDPKGVGKIEWAMTCSRARPGEFGGGVVVFNKDNDVWENTGALVDKLRKQLKGKK